MREEEADESVHEIERGKVSERGDYVWDCPSRKLRVLSVQCHVSQLLSLTRKSSVGAELELAVSGWPGTD